MDSRLRDVASRVVESNHDREDTTDDAIFAELEAEIENDDSAVLRERGLVQLRLECVRASLQPSLIHGCRGAGQTR